MDQAQETETPLEIPPEESFTHTLKDGCEVTVFKPSTVLRVRLRKLLGESYYKDDEFKNIGTAFLCIRKWSTVPSPLGNPNQFDAMLSRFANDDDLDAFMEKYSKLTQPELTKVLATAMEEALEQDLDEAQTRALVRERTLPFAKARLEKLRD